MMDHFRDVTHCIFDMDGLLIGKKDIPRTLVDNARVTLASGLRDDNFTGLSAARCRSPCPTG